VQQWLGQLDGVMVGREAYHNPWWLAQWDPAFFDQPAPANAPSREEVERQMVAYMARQRGQFGTPWPTIARHMLGLRQGLPGARHWRRVWSDHRLKHLPADQIMAMAHAPPVATRTPD
jgi:tRNA-dihydrouridine synthase A